jgi:1-acyl-sn-glycerol-3-phosphate acyltransferase
MPRPTPVTALRLGLIGLHLLSGAAQLALLYPFAGPAARNRLKRRWSRQLLARLGVRVEFRSDGEACTGLPLPVSGLLVSNHVSFIDIFVINAVLPATFVSKDDVAHWPLIGWLCRGAGTLFMARGSRRAAHLAQQQMLAALAGGQRMAIFPEGTSSDGRQVLAFHAALFQAAIEAGQPVHALALRYLDRHGEHSTAPAYIDDIGMLDCLIATLSAGGLRAELTLVGTLPTVGSDRRTLARSAHDLIEAAVLDPDSAPAPIHRGISATAPAPDPANRGGIPEEAPCAISP